MSKIAVLLTDFGWADNYAGVMKGVLLKTAPDIQIVDLTHGIAPQDIRAAAFQLMTATKYFPDGALFIAVVDPGVGTARRIIFGQRQNYRFLAPDNGLLSWVMDNNSGSTVIALNPNIWEGREVSRTFHARDIFAPVAGRILNGEDPNKLGRPITDWVQIPFPPVQKTGSKWEAAVLYEDRFGNLITNLPSQEMEPLLKSAQVWFEWGDPPRTLRGLVDSYADVERGKLLAIPGSHGFVEISVRDGNAAQLTGLRPGSAVSVHFRLGTGK